MHKLLHIKKYLPKTPDFFIIFLLLLISIFLANENNDNAVKKFLGISSAKQKIAAVSLITPTPTEIPIPTEILERINTYQNTPSENSAPWGVAKQLSEHTWTLKVGDDEKMATPQEILTALNNYRASHGKSSLSWSDSLANFAADRAKSFNNLGKLDEHAGFFLYLENTENQKTVGFNNLGENSSIGYNLEAAHLIEWVYASDEGHNLNQLNSKWTHVGIGVAGSATDIIFGSN